MTIKLKIHLTEWYITQAKNLIQRDMANDCHYSSTWLCFTIAWKINKSK
jgi:hypothetical protein